MKIALAIIYTLAALLGTVSPVSADVFSGFDVDADGWTIADLQDSGGPYDPPIGDYPVNWVSGGGQPGGYISRYDPSSYSFSFAAPAKFLGNKSPYYGGTLSFSLKSTIANWDKDNVVILVGNNGLVIVTQVLPLPATAWQSYSFRLLESGFRYNNKWGGVVSVADFKAVLADIKALRIVAEYGSQVQETTDLDSVRLAGLPVLATNNRGACCHAAEACAGKYRFTVWGKIRGGTVAGLFTLDDGSGMPVNVFARDFKSTGISYASATGLLDYSMNPPVLRSCAADVTAR